MRFAGLVFALLMAAGCSTSTRVQVRSLGNTNGGEPLYMMIRSGEQLALEESYEQAAHRAFTSEPDPKTIERSVIIPGTIHSVNLETPEDDMGIYFFFTDYKEKLHSFKLIVSRKKLPAEIIILLGEHEVATSTYRAR